MRRSLLVPLMLSLVAAMTGDSRAQTSPPVGDDAKSWQDLRVSGDAGALLKTSWSAREGGKRKATVTLQGLDKERKPSGKAVEVHKGDAALTSVSVRPGSALVTLLAGGASPFVK